MNALSQQAVSASPAVGDTPVLGATIDGAVTLAAFLDRVASVLRTGLPERVWIAATVVDVRASASGHTLELADPGAGPAATLRVFLASSALVAIRRDLGVPVDPTLLVGMTTCILVAPSFTRRWHLGGRVDALAGSVAASLRQRLLERTVAALKAEGLWDRQRRLPRPRDITRIAVIHPVGAAGWADIAGELGRWERAGLLRVRSHPARFEGDGAATAIVTALRDAVKPIDQCGVDVVLLVRGGGARTSLVALDDEAVARAIVRCPIPIVCGTGHATDVTLADRVAWYAADTPSKALHLVAGVICDATRAARANHIAILTTASALATTEQRRLRARRDALLAAFDRAATSDMQGLAAAWSEVRIAATRHREQMARLGDGAAVLLRVVVVGAPAALDAEARRLQRLIGDSLDRAWRIVSRHDDGAALLGTVHQAARARLLRHDVLLTQVRGTVARYADDLLHDAEVALGHIHAILDASDVAGILRRGFALVTDPTGTLLPTRAEAAAQGHIVIRFADGPLRAIPERPDEGRVETMPHR